MVQIHGKRYALRGETGESDILTLINSCFTHQTGKGDLHNERPGINTILENGWCNNLSPDHRELKWVRNTCLRANLGWMRDARQYHRDLANGDIMGSVPLKARSGGW